MSEFVCPNTFCTFGSELRMINQREGGQKHILLELKVSSKNFTSRAIGATRKSYCCRSPKYDAIYQPQLKMLLLLHLWKELLNIRIQ